MCTATCTEIVPPLRIPGGGSKRSDCQLETAIDLQKDSDSIKLRCLAQAP